MPIFTMDIHFFTEGCQLLKHIHTDVELLTSRSSIICHWQPQVELHAVRRINLLTF